MTQVPQKATRPRTHRRAADSAGVDAPNRLSIAALMDSRGLLKADAAAAVLHHLDHLATGGYA